MNHFCDPDIIGYIIVFVWSVLVLSFSLCVVSNSMKWRKKHRALRSNLLDAFVLMMREGGERKKIADEILQSLSLGHPLHWFKCQVCRRWRPFEKTGVNKQIIRDDEGKEIGHSNVVFCSDIENCIKNAGNHHPEHLSCLGKVKNEK